jgi:hypothetical protein
MKPAASTENGGVGFLAAGCATIVAGADGVGVDVVIVDTGRCEKRGAQAGDGASAGDTDELKVDARKFATGKVTNAIAGAVANGRVTMLV